MRNSKYKWDTEDRQLLAKHWSLSPKEEIQALFPNINWHAVTEMARKEGLKRQLIWRKGTLEPLLEESLEAYYWMGFIYADGWISKEGQVVLSISEKDRNQLEKLATLLETNISTYGNYGKGYNVDSKHSRIAVRDQLLATQIKAKFNYVENKTYNPPPSLSFLNTEEKFMAWLIGFIDGDGSISKKHGLKGRPSIRIECHSGVKPLFEEIKNYFSEYHSSISEITEKDTLNFYIGTELSQKLKDFSHKVPFMERKWNRFDTI